MYVIMKIGWLLKYMYIIIRKVGLVLFLFFLCENYSIVFGILFY